MKPGDALFSYQQQPVSSEYRHLQALRPLENKTANFENQQITGTSTHGEISIHEGLTSVEKNKRMHLGLSSARGDQYLKAVQQQNGSNENMEQNILGNYRTNLMKNLNAGVLPNCQSTTSLIDHQTEVVAAGIQQKSMHSHRSSSNLYGGVGYGGKQFQNQAQYDQQ